jgi:hypothetical protein
MRPTDILPTIGFSMQREDFMHKSIWLAGGSVFFAASLFHAPPALAASGSDSAFVVAQGVTGAPHGGPTGTGGSSGVNDHDAGTDINDSYNNPAKSTTSALDKTTSGNRHHHRHRNSENNNMNPPGTYNGTSATNSNSNPAGASNPNPVPTGNTGAQQPGMQGGMR